MRRRGNLFVAVAALAFFAISGCTSSAPHDTHDLRETTMSAQPTGKRILEELLDTRDGVALCWLGNLSWLIRAEGRLIAFDLDLETPSRLMRPPVSTEELAPSLDAVFITHSHGDHFNDATARILAERSRCVFVIPANCVEKARALGIPEERIVVAKPRQPMEVLGLGVRPMHAFHGHTHQSVHRNANLDDCGYIVTLAGLTLFQPGDSVLTEDHLALKDVDILFVSPTDHNMRVGPASILIEALKPRWIFPQHFATYAVTEQNAFWTVGYPDELRDALPVDLRERYHKLRQGEVFRIAGH
jgi:L-ascorbate metabolism protein UlaG (beta-lactamase superfamily)